MSDAMNRGLEWAKRLCEKPELAAECDWTAFDGNAWHCLLCKQPQFAERCNWSFSRDWSDEKGRWYWVTLLGEQPQFAERCDCRGDFDETDWVYLLKKQPSLGRLVKMEEQGGRVQGMVLNIDPEAVSRCCVDRFSTSDWREFLLSANAVPAELLEKCPWDKFRGFDWVELLAKKEWRKYCHWETFDEGNWRMLLYFHPEYRSDFDVHSGMKYEELHLEDWNPFD